MNTTLNSYKSTFRMSHKYYFLIITLFASLSSIAQNTKVINDFRLRNSLSLEKEITKKLSVFSDAEIGLEKDMTLVGKLHAEIGVDYEVYKNIRLKSSYRYTKNRKNYQESFNHIHRLAFSGQYSKKLGDFKLYYRLQYQNADDEGDWLQGDGINRSIIKNRIKARYRFDDIKWKPYVSVEHYLMAEGKGFQHRKIKSIVGASYPVSKKADISFYFRNDFELASTYPYWFKTLGIAYAFTL